MSFLKLSDEEKMKIIRDIAEECWQGKINPNYAILIVSGLVNANSDVTPLIVWFNDKREDYNNSR